MAADRQTAAYTANFPVSRLGWRELAVRFTPAAGGTVTLTLMGPWEEASRGVLYRQEVLWDAIEAEGARLVNGGFEERESGWQSGGGNNLPQTSEGPAGARPPPPPARHDPTPSPPPPGPRGGPGPLPPPPRADLARPDALDHARGHGRRAGHSPRARPRRPARRIPRDEADHAQGHAGPPGGQALPARRQPGKRAGGPSRAELGRPLHRRG